MELPALKVREFVLYVSMTSDYCPSFLNYSAGHPPGCVSAFLYLAELWHTRPMSFLAFVERKVPRLSRTLRRYWLTLAFIGGFATDVLLLNRVDDIIDNLILLFYVVLAISSFFGLYLGVAQKVGEVWSDRFRISAPLVMQYAFGGLLSGMVIFYSRASDWWTSWPLILLIVGAIVANETARDRASRLIYNSGLLFTGLLLYAVLVVPVITGLMGPVIFILSGLLAVVVMWISIATLRLIIPRYFELQEKLVIFTLASIYIIFNGLYFANVIPPIPLSLQHIDTYQSVTRLDTGDYRLRQADRSFLAPYYYGFNMFHPDQYGSVFCYTEIFAPARLQTNVVHRWEQYDEATKSWRVHADLAYSIQGGRASGYRGFTHINNYTDGRWRCSVVTERGQVLGSTQFIIDSSEVASDMEVTTR